MVLKKILGDEVPEAVVLRGEQVDNSLRGVVLDWNDDTRVLLEGGEYTLATVWTASRVLVRRFGTWVSLPRNPSY